MQTATITINPELMPESLIEIAYMRDNRFIPELVLEHASEHNTFTSNKIRILHILKGTRLTIGSTVLEFSVPKVNLISWYYSPVIFDYTKQIAFPISIERILSDYVPEMDQSDRVRVLHNLDILERLTSNNELLNGLPYTITVPNESILFSNWRFSSNVPVIT